jgi:protocatechuate 3,4-dioxygenase beta subunit
MKKSADAASDKRRTLLKGLVLFSAAIAAPAHAVVRAATPRQPAGPFYPAELPLDDDNDLVHVAGQPGTARGDVCDLGGRLLDRNGNAIVDTRIEIWQCDSNGRYRHPRDPATAPIDPAFQGFGHAVSDASGAFRFRTIRPVAYPGRTPHIHVAVRPRGAAPFVTQLYVADEAGNADDFLYRRIPTERRSLVTADFSRRPDPNAPLQVNWDIVLDESLG